MSLLQACILLSFAVVFETFILVLIIISNKNKTDETKKLYLNITGKNATVEGLRYIVLRTVYKTKEGDFEYFGYFISDKDDLERYIWNHCFEGDLVEARIREHQSLKLIGSNIRIEELCSAQRIKD